MTQDTLMKLVFKFNNKNVHVCDIPDSLVYDFEEKVCEIEGLQSITEIIDVEVDDEGYIDILVTYFDYESDQNQVTKVCLYVQEFEAWCKDLGIKIVELEVIKNEHKTSKDRFDRKRINPTRNNLKLVA